MPSSLRALLDIMAASLTTRENFQLLALRRAPKQLRLQRKSPVEHAQTSFSKWHTMNSLCHLTPAILFAMHVEAETAAAKPSRLKLSSLRALLDIMAASLTTRENCQLLALRRAPKQLRL